MIITCYDLIKVIKLLNDKFSFKNMGELQYLLGIEVCKQLIEV